MRLAIFAGSTLVAKEIDKKTILTLLARPITRLQFLLGKSLGLFLIVTVVMTGLAAVLSFVLVAMGFTVNAGFFIGLLGIALESMILLAFAIFFSTFTRPVMVVSFVLGIFLIGHWLDSLGNFSSKSDSQTYRVLGDVVTNIFPNLEIFNWRSLAVYNETISFNVGLVAFGYMIVWYTLLTAASVLVIGKKDFG